MLTMALVPYEKFRTGLTFREVFSMLWSGSSDPKDWKYKRRNTVLGTWRSLKMSMYDEYLARNDVPPEDSRCPF